MLLIFNLIPLLLIDSFSNKISAMGNSRMVLVSVANSQDEASIIELDMKSRTIDSSTESHEGKSYENTELPEAVNSRIRTATSGVIHTIMIILTIFAFIGNGIFMVYVFWLSKQ